MYRIIFLTGLEKGKRLVIQKGPVVIGREPSCPIRLTEEGVSLQHAVLEVRPDGLYIRNLSSIAPVVVNGRPVPEAKLAHHDVIDLGNAKLQFQLVSEDQARPVRRIGFMQALTVISITFVVALQIVFLAGISMWRPKVPPPAGKSPAPAAAPAPQPPAPVAQPAPVPQPAPAPAAPTPPAEAAAPEPPTAPAETALVQTAAATPAPVQTQSDVRVTEELSRLREDLATLREQVETLSTNEPAPAPAAAEAQPPRAEPQKTPIRPDRLPRRVRIVSCDLEKFPQNDQFEEMRLLHVTLAPGAGDPRLYSIDVEVKATFYDEELSTRKVVPTRAIVPKEPLRLDTGWNPADLQGIVTASYTIPRGFRTEEFKTHGDRRRYYGYRVEVYFRNQLQDADARPKTLLEMTE